MMKKHSGKLAIGAKYLIKLLLEKIWKSEIFPSEPVAIAKEFSKPNISNIFIVGYIWRGV